MLGKEIKLLEDLEEYRPAAKNLPCRMRSLLESLDEKDADILKKALADHENWSVNGLFTALSKKGIEVGYQAVRRHRLNLCSCRYSNA